MTASMTFGNVLNELKVLYFNEWTSSVVVAIAPSYIIWLPRNANHKTLPFTRSRRTDETCAFTTHLTSWR